MDVHNFINCRRLECTLLALREYIKYFCLENCFCLHMFIVIFAQLRWVHMTRHTAEIFISLYYIRYSTLNCLYRS